MKKKPMLSSARMIWIGASCVLLVMLCGGVFVARELVSENEVKRRKQVYSVKLLKPPPIPPKPKEPEKPPEPEIKKEAVRPEMVAQGPKEITPQNNKNEPPPGKNLGLDADGTAGSDGFGLVGNRGGRELTIGGGGGGNGGNGWFMQKYGAYSQLIQDEIRKELVRRLQQKGLCVPKERCETLVKISVDANGAIVQSKVVQPSGNKEMDETIMEVLARTKVDRPRPEGMPRSLTVKISPPV